MVGLPVIGMKIFFGAPSLALLSLIQYVTCGACYACLLVFQIFQKMLEGLSADSSSTAIITSSLAFHCLLFSRNYLRIILTFFSDYFLTVTARTWRERSGWVMMSEGATLCIIWASSYHWSSSSSLISLIPSFMCYNLKNEITSLRSVVSSVKKVSLRRFLYISRAACSAIPFPSSRVSSFVVSSFTMVSVLDRLETK